MSSVSIINVASTLMMKKDLVSETWFYNRTLTRLIAKWDFIAYKKIWYKPLNPKLILIIFKHPVRTSKRPHLAVTNINLLMQFTEINAVYSLMKRINTVCGHNAESVIAKEGGNIVTTWL
jgi:hypothetical protein